VHLIETGRVRPSMSSLETIARRIGVPMSTFLVTHQIVPVTQDELQHLLDDHHYAEALARAQHGLETETAPRQLATAHYYAGRALRELSRFPEAIQHLVEARALFEAVGDSWLAAEALDWEAYARYTNEDPTALPLGEEALRQYVQLEPRDQRVEARMLEHVGTLHLYGRSYEEALRFYEEALRLAGRVRDISRLIRIYHGLARCQWSLGSHESGIELMQKAINLAAVEYDLVPVPARTALPAAENDLGMMLMERGDLARAEELFQSALQHLVDAGQEHRYGQTLLSLAEVRQRQGRSEEAAPFIEKAIDIATRWQETLTLATALKQQGEVLEACGQPGLADAAFRRALATFDAAGMPRRRAEVQEAYAAVLSRRQRAAEPETSPASASTG